MVTLFINEKKLKVKEMKKGTPKNGQSRSPQLGRGLRIFAIVSLLIFVVGGALSIPFVYESQTLWYKFGADKILLRAGKMAGLLAAILLFVQLLLGARGKILDDLFGVAALMMWHRVNGVLVLILALCHVTLVLVPEGITNLPIGLKFWPEMVGAALLLIILSMVVSSHLRQQLGFAYTRWRTFHRLLGYSALALIGVHVFFVSESFEHVVPRTALITVVVTVLVVLLQVKRAAYKKRR